MGKNKPPHYLQYTKRYNRDINHITINSLIEYYFNIFNQLFTFKNLPDTVNIKYFNRALYYKGKACFYKEPSTGAILSLGYELGGNRNIYGEDLKGIAIGFGKTYQTKKNFITGGEVEGVDCVPLYDTAVKRSAFPFLKVLITKLYNLLRLQDIIINLAKKPCIIDVGEENINNIKMMLDDLDSNQPLIIGSNPLGKLKGVDVFPLPSNIENLKVVNENILFTDNQIRKYLGVANSENTDKKERLVVDEINANNQITDLVLNDRLKQRQEWAENVNACFNLNIQVELNEDIERGQINGRQDIPRMETEQ